MASSGKFTGSIKSGHYAIRVDWTQTKNVSANTSKITCKVYLVNDWTISIGSRSTNSVTIDGTALSFTSPSVNSTGTHLLGTVSRTVSHASDGSKTLSMSAIFKVQATLSGTYYDSIKASTKVTLDTIPRASTISIPSSTMGSVTKITITRASSSFTHTLAYKFGAATGTIVSKTSSTSVSWNPPVSLADQVPDATSGTGTITCTTYNGSTSIGSKSVSFTLSVPTSIKPTITGLAAERIDGPVPSSWGLYIKDKSCVKLTVAGATGSYGSTIKSYSISGGEYTGTTATLTTGTLTNAGDITFTAKVTDSRGRTSDSKTVIINVVDYTAPAFSSYTSQRCLADGLISDDGTYVNGCVVFSYASCDGQNSVTTKIEYRKVSDPEWEDAGIGLLSGAEVVFGQGRISTEYSYEVKYSIGDVFTTVSATDVISTAAVVMDFRQGGKGVAIGKVSEEDGVFELAEDWDFKIKGELIKNYIMSCLYPVGSIYMSVNGTNPSNYFGGTWVEWGAGKVPVGVFTGDADFDTPEHMGGSKTVTLSTSQIPSHTHGVGSLTTASAGGHSHTNPYTKTTWGSSGGGSRVLVDSKTYTALTNKSTSSAAAHKHTVSGSTAAAGSGGAHSNLQPYIVCYMWKRTN